MQRRNQPTCVGMAAISGVPGNLLSSEVSNNISCGALKAINHFHPFNKVEVSGNKK